MLHDTCSPPVLRSTACAYSSAPHVPARAYMSRACTLNRVTMQSPCAEDMERMPYLRAVVDEALRLYSPVSVVGRVIPHDMTLPDGKRCELDL